MEELAVVGYGHWGPNHVRVFDSLPDSRVAVIADSSEERLSRAASTWPGIPTKGDVQTVLADPKIGSVVIATPTATHYELAKESLLSGKHVLCEKPLCETAKQGDELLRIARENKRVLMVGHVFLFHPGIIMLHEIVSSGELGRPYYLAASRTNLGPIRRDVNVAYDLASHDIAIFNWLLGSSPVEVSATGEAFVQPGVEDVAFISLRYPGGVLGTIKASWLNPKKVRRITVVGSQRMATWDDLDPAVPLAVYEKGAALQEYGDFGEFLRLSMWDGDIRIPKVPADEPLRLQAESFLRSIQKGECERSDAEQGLSVVHSLEAVVSSLQQKGTPSPITQ